MARRILDDAKAPAARQVLETVRPLCKMAAEIGLIGNSNNALRIPRCQMGFQDGSACDGFGHTSLLIAVCKPLLAEGSQILCVDFVILDQICPDCVLSCAPFFCQDAEVLEIYKSVAGEVG